MPTGISEPSLLTTALQPVVDAIPPSTPALARPDAPEDLQIERPKAKRARCQSKEKKFPCPAAGCNYSALLRYLMFHF